jgi:hypothetical protein
LSTLGVLYPCLTRRGDLDLLLPSNVSRRNQSPPERWAHPTMSKALAAHMRRV